MSLSSGPLGVFDSGVGGLTVVRALLRRNPAEDILYVADQAHVPYGGRPLDEVARFAAGISEFLAAEGCRAIIMACNISSAVALPDVRRALSPLPVFGMIEAAACRASQGEAPRIGVLATEGTVRSGAYTAAVRRVNPEAVVREVACPKLVPLVEAGNLESEEARAACREYLTPLAEAGCETLILGCTHYPFLLESLRRESVILWHTPVSFIDPAEEVAGLIPISEAQGSRSMTLLTTGDESAFSRQIPLYLPEARVSIGRLRWTTDGRRIAAALICPLFPAPVSHHSGAEIGIRSSPSG